MDLRNLSALGQFLATLSFKSSNCFFNFSISVKVILNKGVKKKIKTMKFGNLNL